MCPYCGSNSLSKNGYKTKTVKHCTYYIFAFIVKCHIQGYKCRNCKHFFYEKDTFSFPNETVSKETTFAILDKLKYANITFQSVARDLHLSRQNIIDTFDKYVDYYPSSSLPEIMSWDEKHINKSLTDHAYSFIVLDFKKVKIFDMIVSRHKNMITKHFSSFSKEKRDAVKYITMDMWEPYKDVALKLFRNAKIAIDSFHVMNTLNNAINKIRLSVMQKYNLKTEELDDNDPYYYVLKKYKHYLVKEFDDITDKRFYNKKLKMWFDKHSLRKYILDIDESLSKAYWLVTRYRELNKTASFKNVKNEFLEIVDEMYDSNIEPLINAAKTLSTWQEYIINSFITIDDALDDKGMPRRLSNCPIEGINSQIQKINANGNGYTNFWRFRN